jgi:acyl-CoA dehydrogenase
MVIRQGKRNPDTSGVKIAITALLGYWRQVHAERSMDMIFPSLRAQACEDCLATRRRLNPWGGARIVAFYSSTKVILMPEAILTAAHPTPLNSLTDDEILFRDNIRQFAEEKVRPLVKDMDEKGVFDHDLIAQFFQLGLMGIEVPEQYGGGAGSFFEAILAVEEMSRVDASAGVIVDVQNTLVNNALLRWGNEDQKKRYLPKMTSGTVGAYALSEAGSGSDAFALQTRAQVQGSDYVLNGRKMWITNAKEAGLFILFATIDPSAGYKGITAFIIEKNSSGFTVGKKEDKLGIRASSTCELILEECRVPRANVLGEEGKGYKIAIETLNEGRIGIGAQMAGVARGAWEHARRYAQERKQFGKSIADFQGIQFQLAQMATEIEAARLMVYNAARMKDAGMNFVKEAAMAKLFSSQVAERVTSLAVEIYGGYGFTKDYPVEKYWRDSKIGKIYEGTSNMQLQTIAKLVLGGN